MSTDVTIEATDNFIPTLRRAITTSKLNAFQKARLRLALWNLDKVEEIRQFVYESAIEEAIITSTVSIMAVNWDAIFAFIEKLIPLIMKLIGMFPSGLLLPFIFCLTLAGQAIGQEPKAVIKGPDTVMAGTLLFLNHDDSVGESRIWMITDELKSTAATCGGNIFFAVAKPGEYRFGLTVAGIVDGKVKQDYVFKTIKVTGSSPEQPPVVPPPVVVPVPATKFIQLRTKSIQGSGALADYDTGVRLGSALTNLIPLLPSNDLSQAKVLVTSAIDQVLLTRAGESKKKDWLNSWRIPVSNELNLLNIQDAETYIKAITALSTAFCLNGKCPIP